MLERLEELGVPEPWRWPSRWRSPASTRRGWPKWPSSRARRPAPRCAGGRVADRAQPRRRPARLGLAHGRPGDGDQVLRVHGPRRAGRGRHPRGPRDDARHARPQAQAHLDRGRARLRPRAAAAHRARLRAQPGVDQPHRQRDRRAGRERHDHHLDRARRPVRARRRRRRRARHPGRGPAARPRPVLHHQAGGPGDRPRASTPRARSSRSTTAGRWASTPARAARPSTSGCPSRARCADLRPSRTWRRPAPIWTPSRSPSCPPRWPAARTACATAASGCTCASA